MKVDGPTEDSVKNGNYWKSSEKWILYFLILDNSDNEKIAAASKIEEFKTCSPSFRTSAPSTNPFASSISAQSRIGRGILKPPQLNVNSVTSNNKAFVLKPSQLNPLAKHTDTSDKTNGENSDKIQNVVNGEAPKFVPLIVGDNKKSEISSSTPAKQAQPASTSITNSTFVFGQNLQERVMANEASEEPKASTSLSPNGTNNSPTEMLFSSVLKNEIKTDNGAKETKSLSESAREYEESRACKRKYEEVEVITGEENENNILKISRKLFSFDKSVSSWQERGRGILRLNDFKINEDHIGSRIVFRTAGSLRVILNTKVS